jgi:hypothetical protein
MNHVAKGFLQAIIASDGRFGGEKLQVNGFGLKISGTVAIDEVHASGVKTAPAVPTSVTPTRTGRRQASIIVSEKHSAIEMCSALIVVAIGIRPCSSP